MANPNIVIKKVLETNLPITLSDGTVIYTDKGNCYVSDKTGNPKKITDLMTGYTNLTDLQTKNPAISNKLYLTNDGKLYYYRTSDTSYQPLGGSGTSTTFTGDLSGDSTSQKVIGIQGNIIEDVSYGIGDLLGVKSNGKFGKITPATAIGMTGITMIGDNVSIASGEEKTFTHPTSTNIVPYVQEQIAGSSITDTHVDFSDNSKYTLQDSGKILVGSNKAQLDIYTKLLMHMDDSGFTDVCGHTVTNNSTTLDTSIYKFGIGSAKFNGSSSYLKIFSTSDFYFGNKDFRIKFYIYPLSFNGGVIFSTRPTTSGFGLLVILNSSGNILFLASSNGTSWDLTTSGGVILGTNVLLNQWNNIELCRKNNSIYCFINGIKGANSVSITTSIYGSSYVLVGGEGGTGLNGYIDELNISNGMAEHITNFLPSLNQQLGVPYITANTPLYLKTTGLSNFSLSTTDTITSVTIPTTIPTNTSIKCLFSVDNFTNYLYYDGSSIQKFTGTLTSDWGSTSSSYTQLQTLFTNLTVANLTTMLNSLGIIPMNLDFAFQLNTTDTTVTPTISTITMVYTAFAHEEYADIGKYDSTVADYGVKRINNSTLAVKNLKGVTKTIKLLVVTDGSGSSVDIKTLPIF